MSTPPRACSRRATTSSSIRGATVLARVSGGKRSATAWRITPCSRCGVDASPGRRWRPCVRSFRPSPRTRATRPYCSRRADERCSRSRGRPTSALVFDHRCVGPVLAAHASSPYINGPMAFEVRRRSAVASSALAQDRVARIRAGDEAAFEAMFRAYYDPLCRYVAAYLGSRDAAEDAVQGVFARIWEDRAHWAVGDVRHYLYAAVRRRAISQIRRAAVRRRAAPLLILEGSGGATRASADAEFEAEELWRRLERALAALPPRTRAAFMLSRREGLSYREVALRMTISPKTVGVHIGRALAVLRKALAAVSK